MRVEIGIRPYLQDNFFWIFYLKGGIKGSLFDLGIVVALEREDARGLRDAIPPPLPIRQWGEAPNTQPIGSHSSPFPLQPSPYCENFTRRPPAICCGSVISQQWPSSPVCLVPPSSAISRSLPPLPLGEGTIRPGAHSHQCSPISRQEDVSGQMIWGYST